MEIKNIKIKKPPNPRPGPDRTGPAAARAPACDSGGVPTAPRAVSSGPWPRATGEESTESGRAFHSVPCP